MWVHCERLVIGIHHVHGEIPNSEVGPGDEHKREEVDLGVLVDVDAHLEEGYEDVREVHQQHDHRANR